MDSYLKENIHEYLKIIINKGCSFETALSLLKSNSSLLHYTTDELEKKLSFISNHNSLYAALLVDGNTYAWSIYQNGNFGKFIKPFGNTNRDYIVDMVLDFVYNNKMIKNSGNMSLEDAIVKFKKNITNVTGYHLK